MWDDSHLRILGTGNLAIKDQASRAPPSATWREQGTATDAAAAAEPPAAPASDEALGLLLQQLQAADLSIDRILASTAARPRPSS